MHGGSCLLVVGWSVCMTLTKFASLEWASPQNLWLCCTPHRSDSKCLYSSASCRWLCVYTGDIGKEGVSANFLIFGEVLQYAPKSVCTNISSVCPWCCVHCHFYVTSPCGLLSLQGW